MNPETQTQIDFASLANRTRRRRSSQYVLFVAMALVPVFLAPEILWWVPSLVMFLYLYVGLQDAERADFMLEFADSFYYMGFTLSVGALLASLHPFQPGYQTNAEEALRFFGLGMLTTLIGVFGRTSLQLFYRTPGESVDAATYRIQQSTHEFLGYLEELKRRSAAQLESAKDSTLELQNAVSTGINKLRESLGVIENELQAASKVASRTPATLNQVNSTLSAVAEQVAAVAAHMEEWNGTSRIQVDRVRKFVDAVESGAQILEPRVVGFAQSLGVAATGIERLGSGSDYAAKNLSGLGESSERSAKAVDALVTPTQDVVASIESTRAKLETIVEWLDSQGGEPATALITQTKQLGTAFEEVRRRLLTEDPESASLDRTLIDVQTRAVRLNKVIDEIIAAIDERVKAIR